MRMKYFMYGILISILFILGCSTESYKIDRIKFTRGDFIDSDTLKAQYIEFDKPLNPQSYQIIRDTIILAHNLKAINGHFIELYGMKSQNLLGLIASKGRGEGEFLSSRISYRTGDDFFLVHDYITNKLAIFNIDSLLKMNNSYSPEQNKLPDVTETIGLLNLHQVVGYNSMFIRNEHFDNEVNELFFMDLSKQDDKLIIAEEEKYFPANVNGAYILVSPKGDRIITADFHDDILNFYDDQLNLLKSLKGPDNFKIKYVSRNGRHISFKPGLYYRSYYPSCIAGQHIYLLYVGANGIDNNTSSLDKKAVEVFKINWDGNLMSHYILDEFLINISVDSKEEFLYGSTWNSDGSKSQLVRYKL